MGKQIKNKNKNMKKQAKVIKKKNNFMPIAISLLLGTCIGYSGKENIDNLKDKVAGIDTMISNKDFKNFFEKESEVLEVKSDIEDDEECNLDAEPEDQSEEESSESTVQKTVTKRNSQEDLILKAKKAVMKVTGLETNDIKYSGTNTVRNKKGTYYFFTLTPEEGDLCYCVDINTFKVYENSVDGYFGSPREGDSYVFTYDMAVRKLENDLGWDEDRVFTLIKEKNDGYIIRTNFITDGGTGTRDTFYVTRDGWDYYESY